MLSAMWIAPLAPFSYLSYLSYQFSWKDGVPGWSPPFSVLHVAPGAASCLWYVACWTRSGAPLATARSSWKELRIFFIKAKLILRYWTLWHTGHLSPCLWSHPELDFGTGRTGAGFGAVSEDVRQGMDWGLFSHHPLSGLGATGATGATGYWDLGGDRCWNTTGGKRSCEVFRCCKLIIKLVWGLWGVGAWIHRKP